MPVNFRNIRDLLLQHGNVIRERYEFPGLDQKPLSMSNANEFFLGAIIDYQIPANVAWQNARELALMLGPENLWQKIIDMPQEKWLSLRKGNGGYFHRWWEAEGERSIARKIRRVAKNIVHKFSDDVRNIWKDKTSNEVYESLKNDVKVNLTNSDGTINMIVGGLISYRHIEGPGDVKADRHVQRVLGRIFNEELNAESASQLARDIHPDNPWELDLPLYDIGKQNCRPRWPSCNECPLDSECLTAK
ncbi:hypothetical protein M1O18_01500 [Dehalococcoidia bacterium]|nr:hypothetical protein [Dehalococcoidia bacterium]